MASELQMGMKLNSTCLPILEEKTSVVILSFEEIHCELISCVPLNRKIEMLESVNFSITY